MPTPIMVSCIYDMAASILLFRGPRELVAHGCEEFRPMTKARGLVFPKGVVGCRGGSRYFEGVP